MCVCIQALHQLDGKDDLLRLVKRNPGGLLAEDLPESYEGVLTDLQELKESGDVWLIRSGGGDIAYPRDNSCQIPMDDEICKLWHEVKVSSRRYALASDKRGCCGCMAVLGEMRNVHRRAALIAGQSYSVDVSGDCL